MARITQTPASAIDNTVRLVPLLATTTSDYIATLKNTKSQYPDL